MSEITNPYILFYLGKGKDHKGRTLLDYRNFNDMQLESQCDYIQWMFPQVGRSAFNKHSPEFTKDMAKEFFEMYGNDRWFRGDVDLSQERIMRFWGLVERPFFNLFGKIEMDYIISNIDKAQWIKSGNHNQRRMTRFVEFRYNCREQVGENIVDKLVPKIVDSFNFVNSGRNVIFPDVTHYWAIASNNRFTLILDGKEEEFVIDKYTSVDDKIVSFKNLVKDHDTAVIRSNYGDTYVSIVVK